MRILFLLTQDLESPSGLGRYLPMAKYLARLGHEIRIAALHSNFQNLQQQKQEIDGVHVTYVAQMHVLKRGSIKTYFSPGRLIIVSIIATIALAREALRRDADLIVIAEPHPMNSIAALIAKWFKKTPIALDCDDYETATLNFGSKWQAWIVRNIEDCIPHRVSLITTNTHFMEKRLQSLGVPADRISYLPNGVDPDRFSGVKSYVVERLRAELHLSGKKVIAYIGTINYVAHPLDILLEAFLQVLDQYDNVILLIVGGGEDYQHLENEINRLGIAKVVRMVGRVESNSIPEYYQLADVIVDPVHDNDAARGRSPLKLFESWISGVPYITGDVGDRRKLFGEPPAGILVPAGDADRLAQAAIDLLRSKAYAKEMQERGWNRVHEYAWSNLVRDLELALREHA